MINLTFSEAIAEEAIAKEATAEEAIAKEATAEEATAEEATAEEAIAKEATAEEAIAKEATAKEAAAGQDGVIQYALIIITIISSLLAFGSILLVYRLYSDNTKIKETGALVPEQWAEYLVQTREMGENSISQVNELNIGQKDFLKNFQTVVAGFYKEITENKDLLFNFQKTLDEKDSEIKRFQKGYDTSLLKNFLSKIVDLHIYTKKILQSDPENKEIKNLSVQLWDILTSADVEYYKPDLGVDFGELGDLVEIAGNVETNSEGKKTGDIAEILSPGYIIVRNDKKIVLEKARIKYYVVT